VAAIAVAGRTHALREDALAPIVQEAARGISERLGVMR